MPRHRFIISTPGRIDVRITTNLDHVSRSQAARLVREGHVTRDGEPVTRPSAEVLPPSVVEVQVPDPRPATVEAQDLPIDVVYEDEWLAVIDKAPGMVVHPGPGHPDGTLVNALLHHLDDLSGVGGELRPGIVHRLDRGTSGLVVVAKSDEAHRALAAQFADHSAGRRYLALCVGSPREDRGEVRDHLGRHPTDRIRMASVPAAQGRAAVTHWRVRSRVGRLTLVECRLETGRTHQVRVHLASLGLGIVGDGLYGRHRPQDLPATIRALVLDDGSRPLLHGWRLGFAHPDDGRPCRFESAPPADYAAVLAAIGLRWHNGEPVDGSDT